MCNAGGFFNKANLMSLPLIVFYTERRWNSTFVSLLFLNSIKTLKEVYLHASFVITESVRLQQGKTACQYICPHDLMILDREK